MMLFVSRETELVVTNCAGIKVCECENFHKRDQLAGANSAHVKKITSQGHPGASL